MSATPRTDELFARRHALDAVAPWSLCMQLEIELAEADQKWERRLIAALGGHADSKLWGDDGLIAATWRCVQGYEKMEKELAEVRDQLEGAGKLMGACDALVRQLAEAKTEAEKWEKLHDQDTEHLASLQQRDNYGPTETLNETAMRLSGELAEAQKQRDTLAEAMIPAMTRAYARGYNHGHEDTVESTFVPTHASDELTFFADDIRQMLLDGSQPEAHSALAAVKGGEA